MRLTQRGGLLALSLLCFALVGAALVSQHVFDMQPCPWCILQRIIFLVIALLLLAGAFLPGRAVFIVGSVAFALAGITTALYQHFVAAKSSSCNLTLADKIISGLGLDKAVPAMFEVKASRSISVRPRPPLGCSFSSSSRTPAAGRPAPGRPPAVVRRCHQHRRQQAGRRLQVRKALPPLLRPCRSPALASRPKPPVPASSSTWSAHPASSARLACRLQVDQRGDRHAVAAAAGQLATATL
jgi:disulfide bond formation protein DsbB